MNFFLRMIAVELAALAGLFVAGTVLTWCETTHSRGSFWSYRSASLEGLPLWFAMTLLLMAVNGFYLLRFANLEATLDTPEGAGWGRWSATLPENELRLFAVNLIAIPMAIAAFLVIRTFRL